MWKTLIWLGIAFHILHHYNWLNVDICTVKNEKGLVLNFDNLVSLEMTELAEIVIKIVLLAIIAVFVDKLCYFILVHQYISDGFKMWNLM